MAPGEDDGLCTCCKSIVKNDDDGMQCEGFCRNWYHIACVKISDKEYEQINMLSEKVKWYCEPCSEKVDRLMAKVCDFDDFLALNEMVKKLIIMQKEMSNDNVEITRKMAGLSSEVKQLRNMVKQDESEDDVLEEFRGEKTDRISEAVNSDNLADEHSQSQYKVQPNNNEVSPRCNSDGVSTNSRYEWQSVNYGRNGRGRGAGRGQHNVRSRPNNRQVRQSKNFHYDRVKPILDSRPSARSSNVRQSDRHTQAGNEKTFSEVLKSTAKNKVMYGTKEVSQESSLRTVKKMFWLFLSGLDPEMDSNAVSTYLEGLHGSHSYICEKLTTRYSTYSSFKVGVPFEMGEDLLHPNLWPQGCIIGRYRAPRKKFEGRPNNNNFLGQNTRQVHSK